MNEKYKKYIYRSTYMKQLRTVVTRTNVALAAKRTNRHRVLVQHRQIVRERAVHVAHAAELGRNVPGEHRNPAGAQQRLQQLLATVEMRNDHILAAPEARQRDVQLAVDQLVRVRRQELLQALEQTVLDVERRTERLQFVGARLVDDAKEVGGELAWKMGAEIWGLIFIMVDRFRCFMPMIRR